VSLKSCFIFVEAKPFSTDYMLAFKGLFPVRKTLQEVVDLGFQPVALPRAPFTAQEDAILKTCLKDYADEPAVVEEWGHVSQAVISGLGC
jgi:hypothetical protein